MTSPAVARSAPFAAYMLFIALEQGLRSLMESGRLPVDGGALLYLYPVKIAVVGLLLIFCLRRCDELNAGDLWNLPRSAVSIITGVAVFILWINMDWTFGSGGGAPQGYDPCLAGNGTARAALIAVRLFGAAVIVPIMEELFWRSFLLRYVIDSDFTRVAVGTFTWGSFAAVAVLFGLEHHYIAAGIMAGVAYNLLAVYTGSIAHCALSHGVTNLLLGGYVLATGQWRFW